MCSGERIPRLRGLVLGSQYCARHFSLPDRAARGRLGVRVLWPQHCNLAARPARDALARREVSSQWGVDMETAVPVGRWQERGVWAFSVPENDIDLTQQLSGNLYSLLAG
ncbi:MAG: hypothetical protein CM15mP84_07840 [Cellvibrionales bacterium]|nr:MAG: hypothetical protein CM15mP84_07840 [Cellvibrionales bacterium]